MTASSQTARFGLSIVSVLAALLASLHVEAAPPVQVTAADPASAPQGTISLDVAVSGSGFDSTAAVEFLVTGTTNPGGITVKKVQFTGPKKLIATIEIAATAVVNQFDIQVSLSGGRKGKGTSLFAVQAKVNADPCAQAGLDFPAFTFWVTTGNSRNIYLADANGACIRPVYLPTESVFPPVLSYPVANTSNRGRVVWFENILTVVAIDFVVSGTDLVKEPKRSIFTVNPSGGSGLEMSRDGRYIYTTTAPNVVERISVDNPSDRVIVRSFVTDKRRTRVDSVNGDESALYLNEKIFADNGAYLKTELVRVDLLTSQTSVIATKTAPEWLFQTAADPNSNRIVFTDYIVGSNNCYLLQIADGTTGELYSYGQPRFGNFASWHQGKVIADGYNPPSRRNECAFMDMIIEVDPNTSAQRDLARGGKPDGA